MDKLTLLKRLNDILSVLNMKVNKDLHPMVNYSSKEIKKFVIWPIGVDFTKYAYNDIFKNDSIPQKELIITITPSENFEILQCLKGNIMEKYSFDKYLQLYDEYKNLLDDDEY